MEVVHSGPGGDAQCVQCGLYKPFIRGLGGVKWKMRHSEERMLAVRCSLARIVPIQLVTMMTPEDMEIIMCGMPTVDLKFLKVRSHTKLWKWYTLDLEGMRGCSGIWNIVYVHA